MRELAGQYVEYEAKKDGRPVAPYVSETYFKPKVASANGKT